MRQALSRVGRIPDRDFQPGEAVVYQGRPAVFLSRTLAHREILVNGRRRFVAAHRVTAVNHTPDRPVTQRQTIGRSENVAVIASMRAKNNGRYNGNGREWETPPEIFEPLHAEFNFTLDPCATKQNAKCARYYTERENGLQQDWRGETVFMNPPYGREIYAWTAKSKASGALVVGLLPASTDLAWWHDDVVASRAQLRWIRGRVRFLTGGPYRASGFFASVIVIWGSR